VYYDDCENRLKRYRDSAMTDPNLVFDSYHDSYSLGGVFSATANLNHRAQNASTVSFRRDNIKRQGDLDEPWVENNTTTVSFGDQFEYTVARDVRAEIGAGLSLMKSNPEKTSTTAFDLYGGVTYSPRSWLDLHVSASRVTRFPTLNQLYADVSGNPDLSAERAVKLEFGYRTRITKRLAFDQTYFRSDIKGLIDRKDRNSLYENLEKVDLSGLETGLSYTLLHGGANLSYMYLHAYEYNVEGELTTKSRRSHSPRHKIDYQVYVKTGFGLGVSHTGQSFIDRVDPNKEDMQDYFIANVKATYRVMTAAELFVNVRNIFDVNYQEELFYPMPGRLVSAGVEVKF
jgi:outer membrane receptor protein involved in Fe transport